ncbi:HD-GYP domain-containing protein [Clostridium sp. BJN0001]|uniref:HD-GYP domain-containing protein n=1 Tax=Clostridium sp. BJN0001 TaxID=2930219 RepID=UPI001FD0F584|nr:HD-GYP domain-containing protein [Clostridium sp. BJN0001]
MAKVVAPLKVSELKEGMLIVKDIVTDGDVLVKQNVNVTNAVIKKIKDYLYFGDVFVQCELDDINDSKKKKEAEFGLVEKTFNEFSDNLKDFFSTFSKSHDKTITEVREMVQNVKAQLGSDSFVIRNIILNGSGEDCIFKHTVDVAALSSLLGKWLHFSKTELNLLTYAAIFHDCGKYKIDPKILNKKEELTEKEFDIIKQHPVLSYNLVKEIKFLDKSVSLGVIMHHEREDGSGYPFGLKGEKIHKFAKVIAIADVFDAINSNRGYKNKELPFQALQTIKDESLGKLQYEYCNVFLQHIIDFYLGEKVILNTGEEAKILQMNINELDRPLVFKNGEFLDLTKDRKYFIKKLLK